MTYEAHQSIYRLSQDVSTLRLTFFVYDEVVSVEAAERLMTLEELHDLLILKAHDYQKGMKDDA